MPSYLAVADRASPVLAGAPAGVAGPPAGMVAFRTADLRACGGEPVAAGTMMTFCHPVVTVPAVIRGGAVRAGRWLPDFVRLGELERHLAGNVIEDLVGTAIAEGRMPAPQRRRIMSYPLTIRLVIAMTLMPDAGYAEVIRRLAGRLADVTWAAEWHVPTPKVVTGWRERVPASMLEELFWSAAGPLARGSDGASVFKKKKK